MLLDLDYFYAQCEEKRNPSIRGKPVVVCVYSGRSEDSGAVSTANYIARRYGVKSGIPISLAKQKLKDVDAVFLPVDHPFYREVSEKVMAILRNHADQFEQVGIDEAYLDVTQRTSGSYEETKELAARIKKDILTQQELTCSIGVGPNKLVAKIAADMQKPDGLTMIEAGQVGRFLSPLQVSRLVGVGRKTEKKMENMGIRTVGDLAGFDVQRLVEVFGRKLGSYFHNASLGIDDEPVQERGEAESMSKISTLKENTRKLEVIIEEADKLCDKVYAKLLDRGLSFRSVSILVVASDLSVHTRSKTIENPTKDLEVLKKTVRDLFTKFLKESDVEARRVGVKASNLTKEEQKQKQITNFFGSSND
uniref:DNA polymerase IV n=1 Tax=uncultured miscellaneous Crenarchaeota group TaxID=1368239 RepID=W8RLZ5_9ARCH|nr:DNA-directed DNA polymerase [uncultured miscellaneous Crenarchaeota group]